MENQKLPSTNINCDTGILGKLYSNHWKYWIFNVEIFTFFIILREIYLKCYTIRNIILIIKDLER